MALILPQLDPCPFCSYLLGVEQCVFVERTDTVAVLLNPRQYETGALLIIPIAHVATVLDASDELVRDVHQMARRWASRLVHSLGATGVNVFQNNGVSAGQTVPHYHVHVVPRYPDSDPARRFREADFERSTDSDLLATASRFAG